MTMKIGEALESLSAEERRFPPPPELAAHANVTEATFTAAAEDELGFWAEQASRLSWGTEPTETRIALRYIGSQQVSSSSTASTPKAAALRNSAPILS